MDLIAQAMAEVAATGSTDVPLPFIGGIGGGTAGGTAGAPASGDSGEAGGGLPFRYDPATIVKCTDCKTCYQEIPEYFESSTEVIDGVPTPVARLIPGSIESVEVTPELQARVNKVIANCDAEIIL